MPGEGNAALGPLPSPSAGPVVGAGGAEQGGLRREAPAVPRPPSAIELTANLKYHKVQLVEEGFNPAVVKDRLHFLDDKENLYVQMNQDIYNSVKKNVTSNCEHVQKYMFYNNQVLKDLLF